MWAELVLSYQNRMTSASQSSCNWVLRKPPETIPEGGLVADLHPVLRSLLGQRGFCEETELGPFLDPKLRDLSDPFELPEMREAVERIFQAVDKGEEICVYGDYDVDGISSITLMAAVLKAYGAKVRSFIPIRSLEGYGLSQKAFERCMSKGLPQLLIAVDCGTVSHEPISELGKQGVDVIVVDHHERGEQGRPDCVALVNPKFEDTPYSYLCAAGVVFKLAHGLLKTRTREDFDLKDVLDLVAVATIADIVPLVGENRLLVRQGLRRLPKSKNAGLRALMKVTGLNGLTTSGDVGFRLGPRINAAGRMDRPEEALLTLQESCDEQAFVLAEKLDDYNRQRQKMELRILEEAEAQLLEAHDLKTEPAIVVGARNWHPGVVGIVASRLMRKYHRPAFVIAIDDEGMGKGSGRSVEGVSLVKAIHASKEILIAGGGHHMAAGISIEEGHLEEFRKNFICFVKENASAEALMPRLHLDGVLSLADLNMDFLQQYERLQPFGSGNPQPVFVSNEVWPTEEPRVLKQKHLKLWLRQGQSEKEAMFFGGGTVKLPEPPWDVAFTIDRNVFRGVTSCQILIRDVRHSEPL